jgi:hypothetical protein
MTRHNLSIARARRLLLAATAAAALLAPSIATATGDPATPGTSRLAQCWHEYLLLIFLHPSCFHAGDAGPTATEPVGLSVAAPHLPPPTTATNPPPPETSPPRLAPPLMPPPLMRPPPPPPPPPPGL